MSFRESPNERRSSASVLWKQTTILLPAASALVYLPAVLRTYAYLDDYPLLDNAIDRTPGTFELLTSVGRPLNGLIIDSTMGWAGGIENLKWLRLTTLIGIALFSFALAFVLRSAGWPDSVAGLVAAGSAFLPAFQVYATWAQYLAVPFAAASGLAGGQMALSAAKRSGGQSFGLSVTAACLVFLAMTIYQPVALMSVIPLTLFALDDSRPIQRIVTTLARSAIPVILALACGFGLFRWGSQQYGLGGSRAEFVSDGLAKLRWFLSDPLVRSLNGPLLGRSVTLATSVGALAILGILVSSRRWTHRLFAVAVSCIAVLVAYAPNLVTAEDWASYRTQAVLSTLILIVVARALRAITNASVPFRSAQASNSMLITLVITMSIFAGLHADGLISRPQEHELDYMTREYSHLTAMGVPASISIIRANWDDSIADVHLFDEFGIPSAVKDYTIVPMLDRLSDMNYLNPPVNVEVIGADSTSLPEAPYIDMRLNDDSHSPPNS